MRYRDWHNFDPDLGESIDGGGERDCVFCGCRKCSCLMEDGLMSDRRPEKLWVRDEAHRACEHEREASPADLLAVVRRGVESGTIKGKVAETEDCVSGHRGHSSMEVFDLDPGTYLVIGPVSDGGSET